MGDRKVGPTNKKFSGDWPIQFTAREGPGMLNDIQVVSTPVAFRGDSCKGPESAPEIVLFFSALCCLHRGESVAFHKVCLECSFISSYN